MNSVTLIGNVGKDPESRTTGTGKTVCNFSLATSEKRGGEDKTSWHRCVAFDKTAELIGQYVGKGSKVAVQGKIQYRDWEDKDGIKRTSTEILVDRVEFLSPKKSGSGVDPQPAAGARDDDDIPF